MSAQLLARVVRERAQALLDLAHDAGHDACLLRDNVELARVVARVLDGKPVLDAFGAPGDWGYGTPIGDALLAAKRAAVAAQRGAA